MKKIQISSEIIPYLLEMYYELLSERFSSKQIPDNRNFSCEGRNIWVAENSNPRWYRDLVRKYPRNRGIKWPWKKKAQKSLVETDSLIKRSSIERILLRITSGKYSHSKYLRDLIEEAERRLKSSRSPLTEAEVIFCQLFHIVLVDKEIIELINQTPVELWDEVADYYKRNSSFPDWLIGSVPF